MNAPPFLIYFISFFKISFLKFQAPKNANLILNLLLKPFSGDLILICDPGVNLFCLFIVVSTI